MAKINFNKFKVTQKITHSQDGSKTEKIREFKSLSDFKRAMAVMGFPTHVTYTLQKHKHAVFDYEEFQVELILEDLSTTLQS